MQNSSHLTKSSLKLMEPTQKLRQAPTCVYNVTTAAITTTLRQKSLSASQWRLALDVAAWAFVRGTSALWYVGSAQRRARHGSVECCCSVILYRQSVKDFKKATISDLRHALLSESIAK